MTTNEIERSGQSVAAPEVLPDSVLYENEWPSPIFNHPRKFWDSSYFVSLDSHPAAKVVIFGLPKSGNVWLKSLLVDYFEWEPIDPVRQIGKRGIGITHRPFEPMIGQRRDFVRGVCLVRDIRDIVVSYWHYSQTQSFRKARPEFHYEDIYSFYYDWFLSRVVPAHQLPTFSERYARLGVPVLRYEKLREDTEGELSRLLLRWGIKPDPLKVRDAVQKNDLDKMKQEGKHLEKFIHKSHFRKGVSGGYKRELPQEIVVDIETRFHRTLARWGYLARR